MGVEESTFNATFLFKGTDEAKTFTGRATAGFGAACLRLDEQVNVLIPEQDYESLVKLADELGGGLVVG
jgi:hypothetical protein